MLLKGYRTNDFMGIVASLQTSFVFCLEWNDRIRGSFIYINGYSSRIQIGKFIAGSYMNLRVLNVSKRVIYTRFETTEKIYTLHIFQGRL